MVYWLQSPPLSYSLLQILCQRTFGVISVFQRQLKSNSQNFKEKLCINIFFAIHLYLVLFLQAMLLWKKKKICSFKIKIYFLISEGIVDDYLVWYILGGVNCILPVNDEKWVSSSKYTNLKNSLNVTSIHAHGASKGHIIGRYKPFCTHMWQLVKCSFLLQEALFAVKLDSFKLYLT